MLAAHAHVRQRTGLQHALLVVAPTDEARGWGVVRAAGRAGFGRHEVARAGEGGVGPAESVAVYVADVAGAEYAFYEQGRVVLVGDSFVRGGKGWSFGEAAHQACCVVHGPWYDGFDEIVAEVHEEMALQRVLSVGEMAGGEGEVWTAPCVEALDEEDVIELVVAAMGNGERMKRLGSAFQKAIVQLETAAGNDAVQLVGDLMRLAAISTG